MGFAEETGKGVEAEPSQRPLRRSARPRPGSRERPGHGEGREVFGPSPPPAPDPLSIELRVWQTGPTALENERTPRGMREAIDKMKHENPKVTFEYLDDAQQRDWVVEHMAPDVVNLYDGLPNAVMRADLWRYMVVATEGGLYLDSDTAFTKPAHFLQTSDRDLHGALSFEELNKALDEIVAGRYTERALRGGAPETHQSPEKGLSQFQPVASTLSPQGTSIFFSEIETAFRHLDIDGDGKLELFEIYPFQSFVSTRFGVENDGGNDSLLLRRFGLQTSQLLEKKDLPPKFIEDIDKAFSDPHNLLRTYDRDFDSALAFEEFRKALDDVAEGRGLSPEPQTPEPPEPPRPPEFPQQPTGRLWEIDTGDYSGLAGLAVAAHDIIDPEDDFAGSIEDTSTVWLFVAAGAIILLAAGVWCAWAQLARWRRGGLKTKAR